MQSESFRLFILDRQPLIKRPCIIKEISHTENMSDAQCSVSGIEMPVIGKVADCFWNKIGMKGGGWFGVPMFNAVLRFRIRNFDLRAV